ncbi:MAG: DUF1501 domain-containing protein [Chloroflexota bacterium]
MAQSRRDFLKTFGTIGAVGASLSILPKWMPRVAFAQADHNPTGNTVVVVSLRGGIDGLAALAPIFEGERYYRARPTQHLRAQGDGPNASIDLDGRFGMHRAMEPLKRIYDNGDLVFVHATGLTDPTRSHFDAMLQMEVGTPGDKFTATGWLGRYLQSTAERSGSPFRSIGMGAVLPTSLRGPVSSLALKSIVDFHLGGRPDEAERMRNAISQLYMVENPVSSTEVQGRMLMETLGQIEALRADEYTPANGAEYPESEFGMGMQQIARFIKADVGTEVATVDLGGWDTHDNQGTAEGMFNYLLEELTQGLSAFYTDLGDRMNRVTVITMSEFGRTLRENASGGTDHGHGNIMMLMGGGVSGGQVYTDWPTLAPEALADGDLNITTDYRDVLSEVVRHQLHNDDIDFIFPNFTHTPLGLVVPA